MNDRVTMGAGYEKTMILKRDPTASLGRTDTHTVDRPPLAVDAVNTSFYNRGWWHGFLTCAGILAVTLIGVVTMIIMGIDP